MANLGSVWKLLRRKIGKKLCTTPTHLNYEIVREFYANVILVEDQPYSFMTMVRGRPVSFSRDVINAYLGNIITLEEDVICEYGKRLAIGNWNIELVKDTLVRSGKSYEVNAMGALKNFLRRNLVMEAQTPRTLAFPGMIMGLCQRASIPLPAMVHETIDSVVDDMYIERYWQAMLSEGATNEEEESEESKEEEDMSGED
ncbi:hypothetical protein KIW84_057352 [Lathyrus oleraceus]|uniref:Putative plant transposon protein domain-containing protein n=1 Tax=Pisum sativum TaxID=3888 RepID=A0A9D4X2X3_PEA|nr:hypothetical protein KIW84_057352 [Pisum sativum]